MIAINMKMPENCVECRFSQGEYLFCYATPENFCGYVYENEDEGRPGWCPLKAQEASAVHVTAEINYRKIGNCPNCGKPINFGDYPNYCGRCGRAVKWE